MTPIIVDYTIVDLSGLAGLIPSDHAIALDIDRQLRRRYHTIISREPRMMSAMWLITGLTVGIEWSRRLGNQMRISGLTIAD